MIMVGTFISHGFTLYLYPWHFFPVHVISCRRVDIKAVSWWIKGVNCLDMWEQITWQFKVNNIDTLWRGTEDIIKGIIDTNAVQWEKSYHRPGHYFHFSILLQRWEKDQCRSQDMSGLFLAKQFYSNWIEWRWKLQERNDAIVCLWR